MRESSWSIKGYVKAGLALAATITTFFATKASGLGTGGLSKSGLKINLIEQDGTYIQPDGDALFGETTSPWQTWTEQGEYVSHSDYVSASVWGEEPESGWESVEKISTEKTWKIKDKKLARDPDFDSMSDASPLDEREGERVVEYSSELSLSVQPFLPSRRLLTAMITDDVQVNTYTSFDQSQVVMDVLPTGGFIAVWQSYGQDGSGWGIYSQIFDDDGRKIGGEQPVNLLTVNSQITPSVVVLPGGNITVAYLNPSQKMGYVQLLNPMGIPYGVEQPISGVNDVQSVSATLSYSHFVVSLLLFPNSAIAPIWHARYYDFSGSLLPALNRDTH